MDSNLTPSPETNTPALVPQIESEFPTKEASDTCNGKVHRQERYCKRPAGWGTDHAGSGRCKLHGGCSTGPKSGWLRYSNFTPSSIVEMYETYAVESDQDIKSLNDEIALLRAKIANYESRNNDGTHDKVIVGLAEEIRRLIETKQSVEEGVKTKVNIEVVVKLTDELISIIDKNVKEVEVKKKIAADMRRLNFSQLGLN